MHNLADIQEKLKNAIFGAKESLDFIKPNGVITANDRIMVHCDTVLENFVTSLKITYPGIWQLIGENCARGAALAYSHNYDNLTNRSAMGNFGENFPAFLGNFPSTKHLQYLPDYARLELLKSRSYAAPRQSAINLEELQSFFDADIESCKLLLNASIFFLKSIFPLMNIQELLDNSDSDELYLNKTECFVMICRVQNKIETLYMGEKQWKFFQAINAGSTIGKAMEVFTENEMEEAIATVTHLMLDKQMITKMR